MLKVYRDWTVAQVSCIWAWKFEEALMGERDGGGNGWDPSLLKFDLITKIRAQAEEWTKGGGGGASKKVKGGGESPQTGEKKREGKKQHKWRPYSSPPSLLRCS